MGSEDLEKRAAPNVENKAELTGPQAELAALKTNLQQVEFVMESLKMERDAGSEASRDVREAAAEAQVAADGLIAKGVEKSMTPLSEEQKAALVAEAEAARGGVLSYQDREDLFRNAMRVNEDDKADLYAAQAKQAEAAAWKAGLEENRTAQYVGDEQDAHTEINGLLKDSAFTDKLAALGVDLTKTEEGVKLDGLDSSTTVLHRGNVEHALRNRHHELTKQVREKMVEVPGGKQELVIELLKGTNGAMSEHNVRQRQSLLNTARSAGAVSVADMYKASGIDKYYPLPARQEALAYIARSSMVGINGAPADGGESIGKALGEYAAAYDEAYDESETSTDVRLRAEALERATSEIESINKVIQELNTSGEEAIKVQVFHNDPPSFYDASGKKYLTRFGEDGRDAKYGPPRELAGLFEHDEVLSPKAIAERLQQVIAQKEVVAQEAKGKIDAQNAAHEKLAKIGERRINQKLEVESA